MTLIRAALLCTFATGPLAHAQSLYDPAEFKPMVADKRAHRAGDLLTVLIYEDSSATSSSGATLRRNSDAGLRAQAGNGRQHKANASLGVNSSFDGGGVVQRSERLLARITVTVVEVAKNGDLLVRGRQLLEVNSDKQEIEIDGRVRALDIGEANTVLSSRLADARIRYVGDGALAEHQKPGWLSRALVWMGL